MATRAIHFKFGTSNVHEFNRVFAGSPRLHHQARQPADHCEFWQCSTIYNFHLNQDNVRLEHVRNPPIYCSPITVKAILIVQLELSLNGRFLYIVKKRKMKGLSVKCSLCKGLGMQLVLIPSQLITNKVEAVVIHAGLFWRGFEGNPVFEHFLSLSPSNDALVSNTDNLPQGQWTRPSSVVTLPHLWIKWLHYLFNVRIQKGLWSHRLQASSAMSHVCFSTHFPMLSTTSSQSRTTFPEAPGA